MAAVVRTGRTAVLDPLKLSRPLGAVLALLGVDRCLPLMHGSQGCTAFAKALLTKHFREPIPMQTTAVTELVAVMGSTENLVEALDTVRAKVAPEVIGVVTTGVSEVSGEDVEAALRRYRAALGPQGPMILLVQAPDFSGGLSDGWSAALTALVEAGLAEAGTGGPVAGQLFPILAGVSLTAADLDEIGLLAESFGLLPLPVPDLSTSLDGHLAPAWSPLTTGGVSRAGLASLAGAAHGHAVGITAGPAASVLAARAGTDVPVSGHLAGLAAVDGYVDRLRRLTGVPVPPRVRRDRARLADALLDTHFVLGEARVAVAAEPELLAAVTELVAATGARVVTAVAPTDDAVLASVQCAEVVVGDLGDLRERAAQAGAEVVVGSSHAVAAARAVGAAHVPLGIPVEHRFGAALGGVAGYRGGLRFVTELANAVLAHREEE